MRCLLVLCLVVVAATAAEAQSTNVFKNTPYRPQVVVAREGSGSYNPGRYDAGRYDPGRYDPNKYNTGRYDPGKYDPSKYDQSGRWIPDKSGLYDGDRGDRGGAGGFYDGGYGDRGLAGGFYNGQNEAYVNVPEPVAPTTTTTTTTTPKPRVKPVDYYQYKYGIDNIEKELLSKMNIVSGTNDGLIGKSFFEYVNPQNEVYRTDYIADSAFATL